MIDFEYNTIIDEFVKPEMTVLNYNTQYKYKLRFSGITEQSL